MWSFWRGAANEMITLFVILGCRLLFFLYLLYFLLNGAAFLLLFYALIVRR